MHLGKASTLGEQCVARSLSDAVHLGPEASNNSYEKLTGKWHQVVNRNLTFQPLTVSHDVLHLELDLVHVERGYAIITEAKRFRRRFNSAHEREVFKNYLEWRRLAKGLHSWRPTQTRDDDYRAAEQRLKDLPHSRPVYDQVSATRRSWGGGQVTFSGALGILAAAGQDGSLPYDVLVVDTAAPEADYSHNEPSSPPPVLRVVDRFEAAAVHTSNALALKRSTMGPREFFPPRHGLTHPAMRSIEPPGQLVTASPQVIRGPGSPRMAPISAIRGLSIIHAR